MDEENGIEPEMGGQQGSGRWLDELSWYLLVMGFIIILIAGLCFFLFRNKPLTYADFSLDANVLGKYLLMAGLFCYVTGRGIHYFRKLKKRQ